MHLPIVYTSAACGADLIFIETALDLGAEVNVVLPFDRDDFVRTSVAVVRRKLGRASTRPSLVSTASSWRPRRATSATTFFSITPSA